MAITATLKSKEATADGRVNLVIVTDDTERGKTTHTLSLSPGEATTAKIIARVNQIVFGGIVAAGDAVNALPEPGASVTLTPPDPPPPPEDPAVVEARETWLRNYRRLRAGKQLVADGVIEDDDPALVALQTTVNDDFLPAYVDFV